MIKLLKNKKGQTLVEMALILPILILILMGMVEFGRILNSYLIITNASREGARYASVHSTDSQIQVAINNLTSTLNQDKLILTISPQLSSRSSGSSATVRIDYDIDILTPLMSNIVPDPFRVTAQTTMRVE